MISAKKFSEYAESPEAFRRDLLVDVSGSVKEFGQVQDDWQRADFAAVDPGLMRCNGRSDSPDATLRVYLERPRGHSKTTDLSVMAVWALVFATRLIRGAVYATDQDTAKLTRNAIETLIRLRPWLGEVIEVQKTCVVVIAEGHPAFGSTLDINTSDVASSYGQLLDFIICDELTHWAGDGSLFHSLISTAAKRENCLLLIIANAGFVDSWAWAVRQAAADDKDWYFSRLNGPVASWMSEKTLAEQRRMLPGKSFNRLWLNEWSNAGGDALTPEIIDAAFHPEACPMGGAEPGYKFIAGLDLGLTRDNAALVVLAVPDDGAAGKIRLAYHKLWTPTPNVKVDLIAVEKHLLEIDRRFGLEFVAFDPWQAEHLAQTLEADTDRLRRKARRAAALEPWMRAIPPVAANLRQQATLTIESFNDRRLVLYPCEDLRRDLMKLRVEEKSYGCRLVSPRDGSGHGDTFSAFALALLVAHEVAGASGPDFDPINPGDSPKVDNDSWKARLAEYEARKAEEDAVLASYREANGFLYALRNGSVNVITPNRF